MDSEALQKQRKNALSTYTSFCDMIMNALSNRKGYFLWEIRLIIEKIRQ